MDTAMALQGPSDPAENMIWSLIDIKSAEYSQHYDETSWQMVTRHQCASVVTSAMLHLTNARFQIGCGAIAAHAWLRDRKILVSAWNQTKAGEINTVAKGASIQKLPSFAMRQSVQARRPRICASR